MDQHQRFVDSIAKWTLADLKAELGQLHLSTAGSKADLVDRLQSHYSAHNPSFPPPTFSADINTNSTSTSSNQMGDNSTNQLPSLQVTQQHTATRTTQHQLINATNTTTVSASTGPHMHAIPGDIHHNPSHIPVCSPITSNMAYPRYMGGVGSQFPMPPHPPHYWYPQLGGQGHPSNSSGMTYPYQHMPPMLPHQYSYMPAPWYTHPQYPGQNYHHTPAIQNPDQVRLGAPHYGGTPPTHSQMSNQTHSHHTSNHPMSRQLDAASYTHAGSCPPSSLHQSVHGTTTPMSNQPVHASTSNDRYTHSAAAPPQPSHDIVTPHPHSSGITQTPLARPCPVSHLNEPIPHFASTRIDDAHHIDQQNRLAAIETELRIAQAQDKLRETQFNLTLPPEEAYRHRGSQSLLEADSSSILQLVKQSVDIQSLPPSRPFKFSGNVIDYPKWKSLFDMLIETKDLPPQQKLVYLEEYLTGEALDLVKGFSSLNTAEAYSDARKELDAVYGRPLDIREAYRDKLEYWPQISDKKDLKRYSSFLQQCLTAMATQPELSKLSDERDMKIYPNALPDNLQLKWSRIAGRQVFNHGRHPPFREYAEFVKEESFIMNSSTTSKEAFNKVAKNTSASAPNKKNAKANANNAKPSTSLGTSTTSATTESQDRPTKFCHKHNSNSHDTRDCKQLIKLDSAGVEDFIKSLNLCYRCLQQGHGSRSCSVKLTCAVCKGGHASCLHRKRVGSRSITSSATTHSVDVEEVIPANTEADDAISNAPEAQDVVSCNVKTGSSQQGLTTMILPVYISTSEDPQDETLVYALVDSQSDTSFICDSLAASLQLKSTHALLRMTTMTSKNELIKCRKFRQLRIRGMQSNHEVVVPELFSQPSVPGNRSHIPTPETARRWPHLQHIANRLSPLQDVEISLLIGFNCAAASMPLASVVGEDHQPYAVETKLGWCIVGGDSIDSHSPLVHRISTKELTSEEILKCLSEDFSTEDGTPMSQDDMLFLQKMKDSINVVDGFYTMPLPFKKSPSLPDNRQYAMRRFKSLERKLAADPVLNQKYKDFMFEIISKGEAEICQSQDSGWYIPHHGVFNPNKPGKLRVVFDCSATFQGTSLNSQLLKGPDLNNSLAGLLCRFRRRQVAVTCDITKMFHQFRVAEPDRKYLRFFWYKDQLANPSEVNATPTSSQNQHHSAGAKHPEVVDFQMNVHLFGAKSSPSCAIYGLKKLASDHSSEFPEAAEFFHDYFYVDDGLISTSTAEDAIQLMSDAKTVAQKGNLILHKFQSNNVEVAQALGCEVPTTKEFSLDEVSRALGLLWDVKSDMFKFSDKTSNRDDQPATRRGILSAVASVFDPLGFLSPFTVVGKLLIQDLCKDKKGWDDELSPNQIRRWKDWTHNLQDVDNFTTPRCYLPSHATDNDYQVELHTFSDASNSAYGACSYLRVIIGTREISTSLVMSKSRVCPQKAVTIPRLELQAAVVGVKLADFLETELKYQNLKRYYWTDSETVLGYIANEAKAFHTFVCNRVQRIKDSSATEQWHHVSGYQNPADLISRGCKVSDLSGLWLQGPNFLHDPNFRMVDQPIRHFSLCDTDPEIRKVFVHSSSTQDLDFLSQFDRFGSWESLTSCISKLLTFTKSLGFSSDDISPSSDKVFKTIVKLLQRCYFPEALEKLQEDIPLSAKSDLCKLDTFLDKEGILRVGGRLTNALSSYDARHPILMPAKAHITKLYAIYQHRVAKHQGRLATLNHIRNQGVFLYGQGTRLVSSLIHKCTKCVKIRGQPQSQMMAPLPQERVEPSPPFTHCGMDVFGPFTCKDGRKEVKRYGLLFTCLASRGIHLEMLDDLSTDAFINAYRCFVAIRGPVLSLASDCGTNFIGAKNEFEASLANMIDARAKEFLKSKHCEFRFNPPSASHMGGVWERLIRSVRSVLKGILIEQNTSRLDSASLRTLLYECMAIVNSRPLTVDQLSGESSVEPLPLTPNTLITMKQDSLHSPPGEFSDSDLYSRKRWRRVQSLAQLFWSRWKTEFLQNLQSRQKWPTPKRNLKIDDIVLLVDENASRSEWKLARVAQTNTSKDGLVRSVELFLGPGNTLVRPIHKVVLLVPHNAGENQ